ncbi:MAG: phage tail terminator-like protein [Trueperaceae bacterium]
MAAIADIQQALFARVATLTTSPSLPVAWPEVKFTPPASGKYLRVDFFSNRPRWEGMASGRVDQGLLQITVVWPKGRGLDAPAQIADAIIAHFPLAHVMRHGSAAVKVSGQPWAASPLSETKQVLVPVTIPWMA